MKNKDFVQITKIQQSSDPYQPDIVIGYRVKGYLMRDVKEKEPILLLRTERNEVTRSGIFETSEVYLLIHREDNKLQAVTKNSTYLIERVVP
jgi:hypothetical protein